MPKYSFFINKDEDKIILAYGELLAKQGLIKNPINRYKIGKFIFNQVIKSFKDKVGQSKIIDEKTPLQKELVTLEENPEETDVQKVYKQLR